MNNKIEFEYLADAKEIRNVIEKYFDIPFWEYELKDNIIEESLVDSEYLLFYLSKKPCALLKMIHEDDETLEIALMDVEDNVIGRNNGVGEDVIKILKNTVYSDIHIYGYSVPQAARFWARNSTFFDEHAYQKIRSCDFEAGGLMRFELS